MAVSKRKNTSWQRFKSNRLGFYSLIVFLIVFGISLCAELVANDRPLIVSYQGQTYFPIFKDYPETVFGGDFETPTDFHDPLIRDNLKQKGNWAIYPLIEYSYLSLNYFAKRT